MVLFHSSRNPVILPLHARVPACPYSRTVAFCSMFCCILPISLVFVAFIFLQARPPLVAINNRSCRRQCNNAAGLTSQGFSLLDPVVLFMQFSRLLLTLPQLSPSWNFLSNKWILLGDTPSLSFSRRRMLYLHMSLFVSPQHTNSILAHIIVCFPTTHK